MSSKVVFILFLLTYTRACEQSERSILFNIRPQNKEQHMIVAGLETTVPGLYILQRSYMVGHGAKVLVPMDKLIIFDKIMNSNIIPYEVISEDFNSILKREQEENEEARANISEGKFSFTAYHRHDEINEYLEYLADKFPERITVSTAATTENGREIKYAFISKDGESSVNSVILIDAGIHANEWIAAPVAMYMIHKLVENITENDVVNDVDWVIVPLLNPDGYEYTQSDPQNRMWRKNRSTAASPTCPGVDANRNYGYKWMESGSSINPCSVNYAGRYPFSETETQVVRDLLAKYGSRVKAYVSIHSHGSLVLYPYGYDGSDPPNVAEVHSVGVEMAKAIDANKAPGARDFLVGNAVTFLNYKSAGASDDYAMGVMGVRLAYTLELPSGGTSGFDPPPSRIRQTVTETWPGMLALARYVLDVSKT